MGKAINLKHEPDGTPYVQIYLGRTKDGRQVKSYKRFPGMTDEQAAVAAREFAEHARESFMAKRDFITQYGLYIDNMEAIGGLATKTIAQYRSYGRTKLASIANLDVNEVSAARLNSLFLELTKVGDGNHGPFALTTVYSIQQALRGAFRYFVENGIAEHNPVKSTFNIKRPKPNKDPIDSGSLTKIKGWVAQELRNDGTDRNSLLRRNAALGIHLALMTGMRVGELCALRHCDIRWPTNTISVNGTVGNSGRRQHETKSHRDRNISISDRDKDLLIEHIEWVCRRINADIGSEMPVFTVDGSYLKPEQMSYQFARMRDEQGIAKRYHFHDLRHTHATYLLMKGSDMATVSKRLGHSDIATTIRYYHHVLPGADRALANTMGEVWESF